MPPAPCEAAPWGWSADARRQFLIAGMDAGSLPSEAAIERHRMLSHRRTSVTLLRHLGLEHLAAEEVTDPTRALQLEDEHPGSFFKSPWSCSGRGVFCAAGLSPKVLAEKAAGIIHRQGSVMVERRYDKVTEAGALFYSDGESVSFRGLSMFLTEERGVYAGNIVATQEYFQSRIDSLGLGDELDHTVGNLEKALTRILDGHYTGWLGLDMMACHDTDGAIRLHPCIEINLRMTMGVAAMEIARRLSPRQPMLMSWQRRAFTETDTLLLPPHEGFGLLLEPLGDKVK